MTDKELWVVADKLSMPCMADGVDVCEGFGCDGCKARIFRELVAVRDQSRVKIKYSTRPSLEIPND